MDRAVDLETMVQREENVVVHVLMVIVVGPVGTVAPLVAAVVAAGVLQQDTTSRQRNHWSKLFQHRRFSQFCMVAVVLPI